MVAEVEKRIASGEGLEVKGIKVDTGILLDALELHSGQVGQVGSAPPPEGTHASASAPSASARWCPSGSSRWSPGEASSSLLSSKAIMECEQAEPFLRSVTIEGSEGSAEGSASSSRCMVPVFPRPDVMEKPVEQLGPGTEIEVVARFLSRRDGRVYLRLKAATGWVSTRSCEDMALVVLTPKAGEDPLEPAKFRTWPLKSPAMEVLPQVWPESSDAENAVLQGASNDAQNMGSQGKGQSQDTEDVTEEIEEIGNDRNEPNPTEGSEESQGSEDSEEAEEAESSEGSAQDHEDLDLETLEENVQGDNETAKASKSSKRLVRKFRIISGRLPVLRKPGMSHLLQSGLKTLQKGESFLADGVFWAKAEQRAYLRMTRGLGWICERSKNDLWRLGIVRISQRKTPVSKKMARAVAFRGGDTGGVIRLQKEDLTKNSRGRIVSKRASEASKKRVNETIGKWTEAVKRARTELNVSGFAVVKKGTELYEKAQEHFKSLK